MKSILSMMCLIVITSFSPYYLKGSFTAPSKALLSLDISDISKNISSDEVPGLFLNLIFYYH